MPYDKSLPYSCSCCGYWNDDMKLDYYKHHKPKIDDLMALIVLAPPEAVRKFAKKIKERRQMTNEDDLKAAAEWLYGEPTIYENEGEQK